MYDEEDLGKLSSLQYYIAELPTCTTYEDRLFFINGIVRLEQYFSEKYGTDDMFENDYMKYMWMKKKEGYSPSQIRDLCCVGKGPYSPKQQKQIIVGCIYGR